MHLVDTEEMSIRNFSLASSGKKVVNDTLANHKHNESNRCLFWSVRASTRSQPDHLEGEHRSNTALQPISKARRRLSEKHSIVLNANVAEGVSKRQGRPAKTSWCVVVAALPRGAGDRWHHSALPSQSDAIAEYSSSAIRDATL
jgi:hypothetical protein